MRNIELKAKISSLDRARQTAESIATKRLGAEHQIEPNTRLSRTPDRAEHQSS